MRSRYSAYATGNTTYLLSTWHPDTRPDSLDIPPELKWQSLKIKSGTKGQPGDTDGTVEFVAISKRGGRAHRLHENSRFVCEQGQWFYVDGDLKTD